jgi:hypothetical protein
MKIELKPTKNQQIVLNKYINACIFTYNKGVELFNYERISNFQQLRNEIVTKTNNKDDLIIPKWLFNQIPENIYETPKSMRAGELRVLASNIKSCFSNLKNQNITHFKMMFKSKKKMLNFIINEEFRNAKLNKIHNDYFLSITQINNIKIKDTNIINKFNLTLSKDFKIQKTRLNKWYLILPVN